MSVKSLVLYQRFTIQTYCIKSAIGVKVLLDLVNASLIVKPKPSSLLTAVKSSVLSNVLTTKR